MNLGLIDINASNFRLSTRYNRNKFSFPNGFLEKFILTYKRVILGYAYNVTHACATND